MGKKKIRACPAQAHKAKAISTSTRSSSRDPIIFSFERIVNAKHCFSKLNRDEKSQLAHSLFKRKSMTWVDIIQTPKHGLGEEKIARNSIRGKIPNSIPDDVEYFHALRFDGKKAMVGYRVGTTFYMLWFDRTFDLYDHG